MTMYKVIAALLGLTFGTYGAAIGGLTFPESETPGAVAAQLRQQGWLGIEVDDAAGLPQVAAVEPASPASRAGLAPGDLLVAVNGVRFVASDPEARCARERMLKVGNRVTYTIERAGREYRVEVTLAPMPTDVMARRVGRFMLEHATSEPTVY